MAIICPAVLAATEDQYHQQMTKISRFAHRIQIDLTDGDFADSPTIVPELAWWPVGVEVDFHLMYRNPSAVVSTILDHRPHMIIVHAEADGDFTVVVEACRASEVKVGVALLKNSPVEAIRPALAIIDHVLIFSGDLGHFGGQADLSLIEKVGALKLLKPELEIGWDGGINDQNSAELILAGVDVLNVGGFIQNAADPQKAFEALQRIADETGTT